MDEWMDCTIDEYLVDDDDTNNSTDMMPHLTTSYKRNTNAWISLTLGLISALAWIIPILGLPITLLGSILGGIGIKNKRNRGVAIASCIMNLVFMIFSLIKIIYSSHKRAKLID
ncbi:MAG: hypothetical protein BEN19_00535 [Epulopiscium sp. Nuni2H_MBin003]|nr:MAG: hypothetical protein BEN19_00535 [Epulopiscium sp. Nuni2H_MBin003]